MWLLYTLAYALVLAVTLPWWVVQMLRHGKYRAGLAERLGFVPERLGEEQGSIWIHAVSVGEVIAITGVAEALRERFPSRRLLVSTTTATGQGLARQKFGAGNVFYFPLDLPFAIRAYLRRLRPSLVILAETEFWPNFIRLAHDSGARLAVVNARISDRSLPGYLRFRRWLARLLRNVDLFLAQSELDRSRLVEIGAPAERVALSGNLKFDIRATAESEMTLRLRGQSHGATIVVCGSTVEGEEELAIEAFRRILATCKDAVMVLAPRHPERFIPVAELLRMLRVDFVRRSELALDDLRGRVLLLDSIGELASLYSAATVAFVGGSLAPRGGHNILEPARFGVPIVIGPHTENFRDIVRLFRIAGAVLELEPAQFAAGLAALLGDEPRRRELGASAKKVFEANRGSTARAVEQLGRLLERPQAAAAERQS